MAVSNDPCTLVHVQASCFTWAFRLLNPDNVRPEMCNRLANHSSSFQTFHHSVLGAPSDRRCTDGDERMLPKQIRLKTGADHIELLDTA